MTIPKHYTLDEVACITRVPRSTVNHWVYTNRLAAVKVGRHRLVPSIRSEHSYSSPVMTKWGQASA